MDKKTTMIIAIVAVVAVVAAGATVALTGGNDSGKGDDAVYASQLQIRGNANDDSTINADDMAIVDDIIAENKKLEDYPLADVNGDGKVDGTDKTLLQDLIDRKDGCKVYVVCLDRSGNPTTVEATYPLRNVVPYGTNIQLPTLYANGGQYVAGYFAHSYKTAEASIASTAVDLKGETRQIPDTAWANFTKLDSDLQSKGGVGALLVDYSGIAQITEKREADLNAADIPMIIYSSADAKAEITTVLTLGFLFGGECEELGVKYAEESWEVFKTIQNKVGGLSDSDKTTYIACNMHIYICCDGSTFNTSGIEAGGLPYYKVNSKFAEAYHGTNSVKMTSTEALSNYKDAGAILNTRSMDWGLSEYGYKDLVIETWDHDNSGIKSSEFFKGFETKLTFVNNLLPGAVKVAYYAHQLYGDKFSEAWADGILQNFINMGTDPLKGQNLNTIIAHIDKDVYDKAKGKEVASESAVDILSTFMTNYNGTFATGADSAKFAFANGSVAEKAVIKVANGNTSGYSAADNSIALQITKEAKTLYDDNEKDYSAQVGKTTPMGATYAKANVNKGNFAGLYGYYLNITSSGSASGYLTGYVGDVFFETYFYQKADMTDADFQGVADAIYNAIFNTVKYTGPAIPADIPAGTLVGAGLIAELFANDREAWTVNADGSTANEGKLVYHYTSSSGAKEVPVTIYVGADAEAKYAAASKIVTDSVGQPSMSTKYPYSAVDAGITSVKCAAVNSQMSSSGYILYAMKYGYIVFDATELKALLSSTTVADDFKPILQDIAAFLQRADVVALSMSVVDGTTWSVKDGATAGEATVIFHYTSSSGAKEVEVKITSGDDADAKYSAASAAVTAAIGQNSMSTKYPYAAFDASALTAKCTAVNSQMSSSGYAKFAMQSGAVVIDASEGKLYFSSTDVASVFGEFLGAVQLYISA